MNKFIIDGVQEIEDEIGVYGRVISGTIGPGMKLDDKYINATIFRVEPNNKIAKDGDDIGLVFKDVKAEFMEPFIGKEVSFSGEIYRKEKKPVSFLNWEQDSAKIKWILGVSVGVAILMFLVTR